MTTTDINAIKTLLHRAEQLSADLILAREAWQSKLDLQSQVDPTGQEFQRLEDQYYQLDWATDGVTSAASFLQEVLDR